MVMTVPASRTPRKLMRVMKSSRANDRLTRWGQSDGKAEARAATPAVRLTAAFST